MSYIKKERNFGVLELPEICSGLLVLFTVLWELCFVRTAATPAEKLSFHFAAHSLLCGLVWFNTLLVCFHTWRSRRREGGLPSLLIWQLCLAGVASLIFANGFFSISGAPHMNYWLSVALSLLMGGFSILNLAAYLQQRRYRKIKGAGAVWSPAVIFFTSMMAFVLLSTVILLTPGATHQEVSVIDAFFIAASATSITGLSSIDITQTFTPLGKAIILLDIQVGAVGVMTFSYFVLLMLGKRLALKDRMTISGILDQEGVNIVPALIKVVIIVTLVVESLGALLLYFSWRELPGFPADNLWAHAIFHSVSSFCNAGISLFPENMSAAHVAYDKWGQASMILMMLAGTLGFGVYLEGIMRVKRRLSGNKVPLRWSTHTWLVLRVSLFMIVFGTVGMTLLGILEPSAHYENWQNTAWEALWNAIGRSAGFNLTDINDYGPAYQLFLCVIMFIGGNPAGTGGGVFAPVVALCLLEVLRVLRGAQDVEIHQRRISRSTVERAMATVVLSGIWIVVTTITLLILEPEIGRSENGMLKVLFEEMSAYTTTGYSLGITSELSTSSKLIIAFNMIFGRVGMFTFMMIFIKPREPKLMRYPETRLPLS